MRIEKIGDVSENGKEKQGINGTLVVDVDGTLTDPEDKHSIHLPAIEALALFVRIGGSLIVPTGATLQRVEDSVIKPMLRLADLNPNDSRLVVVLPEYGSAICKTDRPLDLSWIKSREFHTPDKDKLRSALKEKILSFYPEIFFAGSTSTDQIKRDYTLGLKGVRNPYELIRFLEVEVIPFHPEINWGDIQIIADSNTVDFVNINAGKKASVAWILNESVDFNQPIIGFGDSGDEFAKIVPTFNVNHEVNLFKSKGLPYLEAPDHLRGSGDTVTWTVKRLLELGYFTKL